VPLVACLATKMLASTV